ncbi:centromere protein C [Geosmithia morbida]|uniref:CENP-C homolog n=1 Tax=Geosmithia morbida TaxID=1094350 RepID=A0A9P5D4J2_9HYPO|nr:centromere protein C [Geosmithia morbida]KAF4123601.1 centromere protein C [Geosmithia morbida]
MASRSGRRGEAAEPQALHQLGVQGRKTGVSLAKTDKIDDQGFQPLDSIFSSPQQQDDESEDEDEDEDEEGDEEGDEHDDNNSGSEEMEIASSAGPGPQTVLRGQRNFQYLPRSRSPVKTSLQSPARHSPLLDRISPTREDRVSRKLDFNGRMSGRGVSNGTNGVTPVGEEPDEPESEPVGEEEEPQPVPYDDDDEPPMPTDDQNDYPAFDDPPPPMDDNVDYGPQIIGAPEYDDDYVAEQEEVPPSPEPVKRSQPLQKGKQPVPTAANDAAVSRKRPPPREPSVAPEPTPQAKRQRASKEPQPRETSRAPSQAPSHAPLRAGSHAPSRGASHAPSLPIPSSAKKLSVQAPEPPKRRGRGRPPGRKPKPPVRRPEEEEDDDEGAGEASFMALQKGPPMPKRRGLVSMRRGQDTILQTRSGRNSYRPLNWWAGEQVITEDEERRDMFTSDRGFVLGSMKEIVRITDEDEKEEEQRRRAKRRGRGRPPKAKKTGGSSRRTAESESDDDGKQAEEPPEEWETNEGTVMGEVIAWEPEYETHPPGDDDHVHISEEQIAMSASAAQTREIRDATFRFAKTLTMPFMGAGVVDLPPGSEKRPKNSRKMHMVFFVHYGKVAVTVNEGQFRISAGGQWFVPRGNYYSITNDYQTPARIFFAQACEVLAEQYDTTQQSMMLPTES